MTQCGIDLLHDVACGSNVTAEADNVQQVPPSDPRDRPCA